MDTLRAEFDELVGELDRRLSENLLTGTDTSVNARIFDLARRLNPKMVPLCETQGDYHVMIADTVTEVSQNAGDYVYNMAEEAFARYCRRSGIAFARNITHGGTTAFELARLAQVFSICL